MAPGQGVYVRTAKHLERMPRMRAARAMAGFTIEERLWRGTDKTGGPNACWPWEGALIKGYGRMWVGGDKRRKAKYMYTHRLAWFLTGHRVTKKRPLVLHMCDNPPCLNPAHLYAGNMEDNARDAFTRGTRVRHKNKKAA